jgi:acyl-coenzyme A synthetase/AMP-(fatty) acid ligase
MLAAAAEEPLLPGLALFSGGAPLYAEEKRRAARRLTVNFWENYGTTETGFITSLRPADLGQRADSVGQPHSLIEIEVVDDENRVLPAGDCGRLRCRGPTLGSPVPSSSDELAASSYDGWWYPGEAAWLDELGYVFLRGRVSDVIIRGGVNIYPAEIENALQEHPDVVEAAVIGRRAADNEEEIVAFVVSSQRLHGRELVAHCRTRLIPHKIPREIRLVSRLPKTAAGKIDKAALAKDAAEAPAGRAIAP